VCRLRGSRLKGRSSYLGAHSLSVAEQQSIVDALLGLEAMRDRKVRDLYLNLLEREMGHSLPITRDDRDYLDVWCLVEGCLSHPGAMNALVDVLAQFHRDSYPMVEVRQAVRRLLPDPLLLPQEQRELYRLIDQLRCEGVARMYRAAVGAFGAPPASDVDLFSAVHLLQELTCTPGQPPALLVFMDLVADATGHAALRRWSRQCAARLAGERIESGQSSALDTDYQPDPAPDPLLARSLTPAYLVLRVEPHPMNPRAFHTSAWLQRRTGSGGVIGEKIHEAEESCPLPEVPGKIDSLLVEVHNSIAPDVDDLTVEFILPHWLLGLPVDQWEIRGRQQYARRLGWDYPVVVRPLERLDDRAQRRRWREKWQWLCSHDDVRHPERMHWVESPTHVDRDALLSALMAQLSRVCLVMCFSPHAEVAGHDVLATGLHSGIPVMIWCRDGRTATRYRAEIQHLLQHGFVELPRLVHQLRVQSGRHGMASGHLGYHLTLLWDDFDRLPEPDTRLSAPV
jgi:hypothetical protein